MYAAHIGMKYLGYNACLLISENLLLCIRNIGKTKKMRGTDISTPAETGIIGTMAVTNEATTTKDLPTMDPLKELPN